MNVKRKKLLIVGISVSIVAVSGAVAYNVFHDNNNSKPTVLKESSSSKVSDDYSSDEASTEQTSETSNDERNRQEALSTLEERSNPADNKYKQAIADAMQVAEKDVTNNFKDKIADFRGTMDNHLSMTEDTMAQTYALAVAINNYSLEPNSIEVYKSYSSDVVQFICKLKLSGHDGMYWAANYNVDANQIQLVSYHGGDIGATFG